MTALSVASKIILKLIRDGVVCAPCAGHFAWSITATSCISIVADLPPFSHLKAPAGTGTTQYSPAPVIGG